MVLLPHQWHTYHWSYLCAQISKVTPLLTPMIYVHLPFLTPWYISDLPYPIIYVHPCSPHNICMVDIHIYPFSPPGLYPGSTARLISFNLYWHTTTHQQYFWRCYYGSTVKSQWIRLWSAVSEIVCTILWGTYWFEVDGRWATKKRHQKNTYLSVFHYSISKLYTSKYEYIYFLLLVTWLSTFPY